MACFGSLADKKEYPGKKDNAFCRKLRFLYLEWSQRAAVHLFLFMYNLAALSYTEKVRG